MLISKAKVAELIPHAGAMCLLDGVLAWNEAQIHCAASSHQALNNPLRHNGRLGVLCGVEYAAQAVALHCALLERQQPDWSSLADKVARSNNESEHAGRCGQPESAPAGDAEQSDAGPRRGGYLASLRAVTGYMDRLDLLAGPLNVEAERLHADASRAIYRFTLRYEDRILLDGRGAVAQVAT